MYEKASGQKVNLQKSSIIFGKRVIQQQRSLIQNILNIHVLGGGGKYLGLPEQFGASNVKDFDGIVQNIKTQTSQWHNQFLSQAGKEVLIKSVLQAKPVYSMSCFLILKTTCDEINSILSEFWWGKGDERRKISWVSWQRMCLPKKEGGMGFRDLHNFNRALLAKQAWRIWQNPNSLISRLYKGRYHSSTTFLQSSNLKHASYGYKSIQVGKDLLQKGLRVKIGDGKHTNVWLDHWLPTIPPRKAIQVSYNQNLRVEEFIDAESFSWNESKLTQYLQPVDVDHAMKIKLSRYASEDKFIWPFTKDMCYTVKSGYWAATHLYHYGDEVIRPEGSIDIKRRIWRLNILPKVKHFLWRVVSGALPTYTKLATRGVHIDLTCQRCCQDDESINHILFMCPHAMASWRCSGILPNYTFTSNLEDNLMVLFGYMEAMSDAESNRLLVFWLLWILWKSRNEYIFNRRNVHPIEDVRRAMEANIEWRRSVILPQSREQRQITKSTQWEPPPSDWLKCNFDYSSNSATESGGLGWILRNDRGECVGAGSVKISRKSTSLEGEALSFLYALQQIWIRGWRKVWFESDNQELVLIINQVKDHVVLGNLLCDIRHWMQLLPESSLEYVNRERNQAADALAKYGVTMDCSSLYFPIPPCWLIDFLYFPFTI